MANKKTVLVLIGQRGRGKIACISNRFCLSAPWPAVTKKRLENTLFSKRTGHFSCSACGLSPEVQPSWRLARVLALLLGFGKVCGFTGRADGPPGTEQVDLHPGDWSFPVAPCIQEVRASNPLREQGEERRREAARSAGRCEGDGTVWWRDPETGGLSGVARRSLVAAAAQLAFAAVAVKSQRLYDVWRGAGWGESSWRSVTHASLARLWSAETRGWRERRDGG